MFREDLKYTRTAAYQAKTRLMDSWCELGLAKSPFTSSASHISGIKLAHYQDTLDSLNMFSRSDESFAILSGVSGVGKTSIIDSFIAETDTQVCVINCNSAMPGDALFEQLLYDSCLEIPTHSISTTAKVSLFLDQVAKREECLILILDDAHMLNIGSLKTVLDILARQQNSSYFKVIMCGRETLYERIIKQYTHEIAIRPLHFLVSPLPEHQLKAYLHSCLVKANWPGVLPEIPSHVLKQIYDLSDGVPYRVNMAADKLLCNYLQSQVAPTPFTANRDNFEFFSYNFIVNCFMSMCYLVLLCGCYGWYSSVLSPTKYAEQPVGEMKQIATPVEQPTKLASLGNSADVKIATSTTKQKKDMNNAEFLEYLGAKLDLEEKSSNIQLNRSHANTVEPRQTINRISPKPISHPSKKNDINLYRDKSILSSQIGYTLQVMASNSLDTVVSFKNNSSLRDKMYIYETARNNQHWYVLTFSNFPNYNAAKNVQKMLHVKHNINGAWVKSMSQVHSEMRKTLF